MEEPPEQVVTEEPLPGWLRYEISGSGVTTVLLLGQG